MSVDEIREKYLLEKGQAKGEKKVKKKQIEIVKNILEKREQTKKN